MNELSPDNIAVKKILHKSISEPKKIKISIIIPVYKKFELCNSLIDSIYEKSTYIDFELIIINDDVNNTSFNENIKRIPRAKYFCVGRNAGFGNAVNFGLQNCSNELVCIMHTDTLVTERKMFFNLVNDLVSLKDKNVVTMCASSNNFMSNDFKNYCSSESVDSPPLILEKNSPFFCTMAYKTALLKVGGFPMYPLCWFEGDLVGHKLRKFGMKQALSKRSFINHIGGATIVEVLKNNPALKKVLSENLNLFNQDSQKIL
jgi:glycosyltransferase involved in cell wall biosynthesis